MFPNLCDYNTIGHDGVTDVSVSGSYLSVSQALQSYLMTLRYKSD